MERRAQELNTIPKIPQRGKEEWTMYLGDKTRPHNDDAVVSSFHLFIKAEEALAKGNITPEQAATFARTLADIRLTLTDIIEGLGTLNVSSRTIDSILYLRDRYSELERIMKELRNEGHRKGACLETAVVEAELQKVEPAEPLGKHV